MEQQAHLTHLLIRQQQESQVGMGRTRVPKAIKPQVRDVFDNGDDPLLVDSLANAFDTSSTSAIAAEQLTSPSVQRNKHIKTMTSLTEASAAT